MRQITCNSGNPVDVEFFISSHPPTPSNSARGPTTLQCPHILLIRAGPAELAPHQLLISFQDLYDFHTGIVAYSKDKDALGR